MDRTDKRALVLGLVDSLRLAGSWCGETHVQKSCYVLQTVLGLPTGFEFILYKHGPFSFDLQEYFHTLRGDELITAAPTKFQFGTSLVVTEQGQHIERMREELLQKYAKAFKTISSHLGKKTVRDLEKIATAVYVTQELGSTASVDERAAKIIEYKKHVSLDEARAAVNESEQLKQQLLS